MLSTQVRNSDIYTSATLPPAPKQGKEPAGKRLARGVLELEGRFAASEIVLFCIEDSARKGDDKTRVDACALAGLLFERLARDENDAGQAAEYLKKALLLGMAPSAIDDARKALAGHPPIKKSETPVKAVPSNSEIISAFTAAYNGSPLLKNKGTGRVLKSLKTLDEPLPDLGPEGLRSYQGKFGGFEILWISLTFFLEQFESTGSLDTAIKILSDKVSNKNGKRNLSPAQLKANRIAQKLADTDEDFK